MCAIAYLLRGALSAPTATALNSADDNRFVIAGIGISQPFVSFPRFFSLTFAVRCSCSWSLLFGFVSLALPLVSLVSCWRGFGWVCVHLTRRGISSSVCVAAVLRCRHCLLVFYRFVVFVVWSVQSCGYIFVAHVVFNCLAPSRVILRLERALMCSTCCIVVSPLSSVHGEMAFCSVQRQRGAFCPGWCDVDLLDTVVE